MQELKTKLEVGKIESNFEEIKKQIENEVEKFDGLIYNIDTIQDAKTDKATLNKLAKSLNDERIKIEKEFNKPFIEFKNKVKSLVDSIKGISQKIDEQVKSYEEKEKQEKMQYVNELYAKELENYDFDLSIDLIFNDKWLNKSKSENEIISEMQHNLMNVRDNIKLIKALNSKHEKQLLDKYMSTLDMDRVLELKEELDKVVVDIDIPISNEQEKTQEYNITVICTNSQLKAIEDYIKTINVKYLV